MGRSRLLCAVVCGALALVGCAKKPPPELAKLVLSAMPASSEMPLRFGTVFGDDAIELVGGKVTPTQGLKPGSRVDVTLYWRKRGSVPAGFRLFTHLLDEAGERVLNLDVTGPLRRSVDVSAGAASPPLLPPSDWQVGAIYTDSFAFWVPQSLRTDSIRLVCGLFRGSERLAVTPAAGQVPAERERATVVRLAVTRPPSPSAASTPIVWVSRRSSSIVVDGKLDEEGWARAAIAAPFVNVTSGEAPTAADVTGDVKLTYDDDALYLGFEVFDNDLRGGFDPSQPDPHLWLKDTVEIMIDPDGDGDNRDYYEIQVGPQNLVFDSQFDAYNQPRVEPDGPFGHQEWSAKLKSAVTLRGTLDDSREDEGYVVEMALPWASFFKARLVPPARADTWRMNFYVIQNNSGSAWSPILGQGNFHKASRFGRVHFAGAPSASP